MQESKEHKRAESDPSKSRKRKEPEDGGSHEELPVTVMRVKEEAAAPTAVEAVNAEPEKNDSPSQDPLVAAVKPEKKKLKLVMKSKSLIIKSKGIDGEPKKEAGQ